MKTTATSISGARATSHRARGGLRSFVLTAAAIGLVAGAAQADDTSPAGQVAPVVTPSEAAAVQPISLAAPPDYAATGPAATLDFSAADAERATFSGGRMTVEILSGAVGSGLASYGTLKAICGKEICLGGAIAALGVSIIAAPTITYGVGRLMGGRGTYLSTILGAGFAFMLSAPFSAANPTAGTAIGLLLIPITAPLMYEINSNQNSRDMKARLRISSITPGVVPVAMADGTVGGGFGFAGTF
jgi:hypothetical protein